MDKNSEQYAKWRESITKWQKNNPEKRREYGKKDYQRHKEKRKAKRKEWYINNRERHIAKTATNQSNRSGVSMTVRITRLFRSAQSRAKKSGREFTLTREYVAEMFERQQNRCAVTGIEFNADRPEEGKRRNPFAPSLDRINPKGGYTNSNVRLVCVAVNIGLNEFGDEVFYTIAKAAASELHRRSQLPWDKRTENGGLSITDL